MSRHACGSNNDQGAIPAAPHPHIRPRVQKAEGAKNETEGERERERERESFVRGERAVTGVNSGHHPSRLLWGVYISNVGKKLPEMYRYRHIYYVRGKGARRRRAPSR